MSNNITGTLTVNNTVISGTLNIQAGPRGYKGEKGDQGDKGDAFTYPDFTPQQIEDLKVKGDKGDVGEKGDQGIQGEKGDLGDRGWSPVLVLETYTLAGVNRSVQKLSDYIGGTGDNPTDNVGLYLLADGTFGADRDLASNLRGVDGFDTSIQVEVSGTITALESWKNKVILVTNDSTITIPSVLFTKDWTCRIIVINGYLKLAKLGSRNWYFGNPEPLINKGSDFIIRQRALTQDVIIRGEVISNPFAASFDTRNTLAGGSTDLQVKLPFISSNFQSCIVDWGDGIIENVTDYNAANTLHTYSQKGDYTIKIYSKGFSFLHAAYNQNTDKEYNKIGEIFSWGNIVIISQSFDFCINLTAVNVSDIPIIISGNYAFRSCSSLTTVNKMNEWNVSNVTQMKQMFGAASSFNQNIGNWNVSNVTNFTNFMTNKTAADYSVTNYNAILNGWSSRPVQPNITIGFGSIKHTSAGTAAKAILTGAPNNWTIIDGGL
jgi:surface protein